MEDSSIQSSNSNISTTFKSKKPLLSTTPKKPPPPSSVTTPDRANPPPRFRNQHFALSVSDVRKRALQLRTRIPIVGPDPPASAHQLKPKRSLKSASLLPQNYEMLCEFSDAMFNSIRLLRLKRLPSTFTRLCRNIESLTDRRFTLHHLAQLKHVLPEVITLKKIRVQDEETNCMKEEILVMLEADKIELNNNASGTTGLPQLKAVFRSRVAEYAASHPEDDEIPEGELPQLFYAKKESETSMDKTPTPLVVSHISPSFKRKFSSRLSNASVPEQSPSETSSSLLETPVKKANSTKDGNSSPGSIMGTPVEQALTPSRFMASTPTLRPPKRSLMSPDHEANNVSTKSAKRRSLKFDENGVDIEDQPSHVANEENKIEVCGASKDVLDVLPEDLVHSLMEKERRVLEEKDPVMSQARKRQKLMAGIPKLFDMISLLFQSIRRSVVTKEELIHKIVVGHLDIVDRKEIEDQLKLLQEIAPEYISEKSSLSGDIVLRLNKSSSPDLIRSKLLSAK